jgi:hypothetical protein
MRARHAMLIALIALPATRADAQASATRRAREDKVAAASATLQARSRVRIASGPTMTEGRFVGLRGDTLLIALSSTALVTGFAIPNVTGLWVRERRLKKSLGRGFLIGAALGAALGALGDW